MSPNPTNEDLFGYPRPYYPKEAAARMREIAAAVTSALQSTPGFKAVQFSDTGGPTVQAYLVHKDAELAVLGDDYQVRIERRVLGLHSPTPGYGCRTAEQAVIELTRKWPLKPEVAAAAAVAAKIKSHYFAQYGAD